MYFLEAPVVDGLVPITVMIRIISFCSEKCRIVLNWLFLCRNLYCHPITETTLISWGVKLVVRPIVSENLYHWRHENAALPLILYMLHWLFPESLVTLYWLDVSIPYLLCELLKICLLSHCFASCFISYSLL